MLNVFTLANGRLFQEEIDSLEALAGVKPVWVDLDGDFILVSTGEPAEADHVSGKDSGKLAVFRIEMIGERAIALFGFGRATTGRRALDLEHGP